MLRSTFKKSTITVWVIALVLMCWGGYNTTLALMSTEYPQLFDMVALGIITVAGGWLLLSLVTIDVLELDREKVVVKSLFFKSVKKVIYLKDIISVSEIRKEHKDGAWFNLIIFTDHDSYKISSWSIANYGDFRFPLMNGRKRNMDFEKMREYKSTRSFALFFILIALVTFSVAYYIRRNDDKDELVSSTELVSVKIAVSNTLSIHRSRRSKSISIEAREFPEFAFMVSGRTFAVSNPDQLVASVKRNDVIEIDVPVDIYQKKLVKTIPMTFWHKSIGYHTIDVYGIRRNGHAYLTLTDINESLRGKSGSVWIEAIMVLMGLVFLGTGGYALFMNKRPKVMGRQ